MAKPDLALLDPARYPAQFTITTRFQDVDSNRHINNVAAAGMLEDVRARFNRAAGLREVGARASYRLLVASVSLEYLAELFYPDPVLGLAGVLAIGRTSWTMGGLLVQNGRPAVFSRATEVFNVDGRPAPLPDGFRALLARNMIALPARLGA